MTHYETLGVPETATQAEIKSAYRKLSMRYHPDRPNGNAQLFQSVVAAYETLIDPEKRKQYDLGLTSGSVSSSSSPVIFGEWLQSVLGQPKARHVLSALFQFAAESMDVKDIKRDMRDPRTEVHTCSMSLPLSAFFKRIKYVAERQDGVDDAWHSVPLQISLACMQCNGHGVLSTGRCPECNGTRRVKRMDEVKLQCTETHLILLTMDAKQEDVSQAPDQWFSTSFVFYTRSEQYGRPVEVKFEFNKEDTNAHKEGWSFDLEKRQLELHVAIHPCQAWVGLRIITTHPNGSTILLPISPFVWDMSLPSYSFLIEGKGIGGQDAYLILTLAKTSFLPMLDEARIEVLKQLVPELDMPLIK